MLVLALIITLVGTVMLNKAGSLTNDGKFRAIGIALNLVSLVMFANMYGNARGAFIYLGVWALVGIIVTFSLPYLTSEKAQN